MPNFLMPDIPGQYQRGKEFKARNALNDIALTRAETQMGQEQRVNNILGRLPNARPEEQMQIRNSLAAQGDPGMRAMQQLQNLDAGQREAEIYKTERIASILQGATPENYQERLQLISQVAPVYAKQLPREFDPNQIGGHIDQVIKVGSMLSGAPAGLREFEGMTKGLTPEDRERARRIELGLEPRAGTVTGKERAATDQKLGGLIADQEAAEAGAVETAKLEVQLDKLPEVKRQVRLAEEEAKLAASRGEEGRQKSITLNMYETAMQGLSDSLAGTKTGPFAGRLPAVTSKQQIAEGAIAVVAPILKSMFRAAGEGVFTDKDQELLMDMVPKRTDTPEAANAKLEMLDAVVRAKLSAGQQPTPGGTNPPPAGAPRETPDNATGVSVTTPDGQVFSFPNQQAADRFRQAAGL